MGVSGGQKRSRNTQKEPTTTVLDLAALGYLSTYLTGVSTYLI